MATERQIAANRRNAAKSTGPRSVEGKAVSSMNALKSGIDAQSAVIPGEDPAALITLTGEYYERFKPATPEERHLLDTLITCEWRLRRYRNLEVQLWTRRYDDREPCPLSTAFTSSETFTRLQRHIDSADRSYHRALRELNRLQVRTDPPPPGHPAEAATPPPAGTHVSPIGPPLAAAVPLQPNPEIGFVPPKPAPKPFAVHMRPSSGLISLPVSRPKPDPSR